MGKNIKAIVLLSGGLDSSLALKLVMDQGIDVTAVKFTSPLCTCDSDGRCFSKELAESLDVEFKMKSKGEDYLDIIRSPKHGYGSGINPCIDCRIYLLNKSKLIAEEIGASFFVTGEVLGQRPMSQHRRALELIEKETGLEGKILRPLSAKFFPETEAEKEGWIDRNRLLAITGRSRKEQLDLAEKHNIDIFACAAGGCLLTDKNFAAKMKDLMKHEEDITWKDVVQLKVGRHFRYGSSKIIVGRNENENRMLEGMKRRGDLIFQVPDIPGPITLLRGESDGDALSFAAKLTLFYSDSDDKKADVSFGRDELDENIYVENIEQHEADSCNIVLRKKI